MRTEIIKINRPQVNNQVLRRAGRIIKEGGLVAFPTETVYGLGANALDAKAAKRIYAAKGRPSDNPLIVHIADVKDLNRITIRIPEKAKRLMKAFWPGPLTLIFQKSEEVPLETTGGLETVAVRMPSDPVARALIRAGGGYVAAPSANTSGRPSPTSAAHVKDDLEGKIDMILDGGNTSVGVESTIVDMTAEPPVILRPGAITRGMITDVIGDVDVDPAILTEDSGVPPKAPGMKYRHYAPKAPLLIIEGNPAETVKAIKQLAYEKTRLGFKVGILATDETAGEYTTGIVKPAGQRANADLVAKNLYRILREFDREDVSYIYSEAFSRWGIGSAVMNRLDKSSGYHTMAAADITKLQRYRRILFVSGSDDFRGPMAAEILRHEDLMQEYKIESRGMVVLFPEPANQKAEAIMRSRGMTMEGHEAVQLAEGDLDEDTLVLTFEENYKWKIVADYENVKNVYTLGEYIDDDREITTAPGQPLAVYGDKFEVMQELMHKLAGKLNKEVCGA